MADALPQKVDPATIYSETADLWKAKTSHSGSAEAYCATVISNLEGWKCVQFGRTKESLQVTIENLTSRIRRLENQEHIDPPPPMDVPSWDGLSWRVARLHRRMPNFHQERYMPALMNPSLHLLTSTLAQISGTGLQSWSAFIERQKQQQQQQQQPTQDDIDKEKKDAQEQEELLRAAAQWLCYLAGKRGRKLCSSFGLDVNCTLALDMALDSEGSYRPAGLARPMMAGAARQLSAVHHHHYYNGSGYMPGMAGKDGYGSSDGFCHADGGRRLTKVNSRSRSNSRGSWAVVKKRGARSGIARFFSRLAFWRRQKRYYDSDTDDSRSITSGSASTVC
ncbi:hypothetical protein F5Y16DRAFT_181811 [Xylariaceae sp. FL0255]|nr:hypothetical protein F5Y16DRAFT_181811 [Xylariaceae sp. FL0255]